MAIFHLTAKVISRGKGQSAIAAAAYRSGEHLFDQQAGEQKAYRSRSERIVFTDIMAPANAPEWVHDRNTLWNRAERAEKRKDAQLAREIEIALPHELTARQREWLVKDFVREAFVRKGYVVDIAIHTPDHDSDARNHHAHLMVTRRTVGPEGFAPTKDWQFDKTQLEGWREQWERLANRHLERHGHEARVDRRSLKEQGLDREPTIHIGYAANEMTERGVPSDRMAVFTGILARNELRFDLETISTQLAGLEKQLADERRQHAAQAQRGASNDGQHRALAGAWASRRRHDAGAQIARAQSATAVPTPEPKRQMAKPAVRPAPSPPRAPEPQPQQVRPVARAAMERKPTDEQKRQPTPTAQKASVPPPRPEPRPEIVQPKVVQQAQPRERPAPEQKPAVTQPSRDREGWRYHATWGWEKIEDAAARVAREEKAAAPRAAAPAPKEPEKTKAAEPQQWGYGGTFIHAPFGNTPVVPIEHIAAKHQAAEQAAAKAREEQQRQTDMADLARAARADDAKLRAPKPVLGGLFQSKVADAVRVEAQQIRAQVRDERQVQTQTSWQNWAQGQNPDRTGPREVAGRTVQAGKQAVQSSFRVANRVTGVVSSLGDFVSNLLSSSSAHPPTRSNTFSTHAIATDPEARKQYQLAQREEARRRNLEMEVIDDIRRDIEAGRNLKPEDVAKLSRDHLESIASKGDAYVRQMIDSARKRSDEYWRGSRELRQD